MRCTWDCLITPGLPFGGRTFKSSKQDSCGINLNESENERQREREREREAERQDPNVGPCPEPAGKESSCAAEC